MQNSLPKRTPVAVFTYNRPQHTARVLETLSRCARLDECRLHIYCDGPSSLDHTEATEASRRIVRGWARRLDADVIERETNAGLARSIVGGVTELCEKYGRVIVIEDDLVVSPDFLDYMLQALDRYEEEANVYQISGHMFQVKHPGGMDTLFVPFPVTWGWATWKRAWRVFDWEAKGALDALTDPMTRRRFDLDDAYPYSTMLEQRLDGLNQSWGILWVWSVFKVNGLVLHPRRSLVWVGGSGADGQGTHCGDVSELPQDPQKLFMEPRLSLPLTFPEQIIPDDLAFDRMKTFLRKHRQSGPTSLRYRVESSLRRYVQRITG
jgi:hypothetical protein